MKKHLIIFCLLVILCLVFCSCTYVDTKEKISDYIWQVDSVTDLDGNPLENEMVVVFNDDNSFILKDESNGKEWKGKYTSEKVDSSYKLDLFYEDTEEIITGVYGMREYKDKTIVPSITFQFEDKIFSFIANE